jgi:hypothetical protein
MFAAIATWLVTGIAPARLCKRAGCAELVSGQQRFHADRCRKAAKRALDRAALATIGAKRCRYCDALRFGDTASVCPDCGAERVGDRSGPCPNCEGEKQ